MIIDKSLLDQFLSNVSLGHYNDYSHIYYPWFLDGPMNSAAYVLSGFQVLFNTLVILSLLFYAIKKKKIENNSFYLIINLALTDIVGFILLSFALKIQESFWLDEGDFTAQHSGSFVIQMRNGCKKQMSLLTFCYLNTILATVLLAIDHYFFICHSWTYYKIDVTKESCFIQL